MLATIHLLTTMAWANNNGKGKGKKTGVNIKPYFNTHAGASTWTDGDGDGDGDGGVLIAPHIGAQAGLKFNQKKRQRPRLGGITRVSYTRAFSLNANSTDVRVGLFAGPSWKYLRLRTGPDYFYNVAQWGDTQVPEVSGLAWPAEVRFGKPKFQLTGGVQPSFYRGDARESVDWGETDAVGIGDEMTVYAAFSAGRLARVQLSVSQTTTAYGTQRGAGINFALGR